MKTNAVRLYGKNDLRLECFELPEIKDDEILARVVSDTICMSTYKALIQGKEHKRVPNNIDKEPVIVGHEFCGEIISVGNKWENEFKAGDRFVIQPALNYKGSINAPGYSYKYIGGDSQLIVIPHEVMETGNLIKYKGDSFYSGSLTEPISCIIGAFNANYHTENGCYEHKMGCKRNGNTIILGGCGPMGICATDYALNAYENAPGLLVVADIEKTKLEKARKLFENSKKQPVFVDLSEPCARFNLMELTDGNGYDDVFVFAPVSSLISLASELLARDGCINFFAGPTDKSFCASINFYDVHYSSAHVVGTSGGNRDDMIKAVATVESGKMNPSSMITHVGGIDSVVDSVVGLPQLDGAKKLIYTEISLPLVRISDLEKLSKNQNDENSKLYAGLYEICKNHNMIWSKEAESYLLTHAKRYT